VISCPTISSQCALFGTQLHNEICIGHLRIKSSQLGPNKIGVLDKLLVVVDFNVTTLKLSFLTCDI